MNTDPLAPIVLTRHGGLKVVQYKSCAVHNKTWQEMTRNDKVIASHDRGQRCDDLRLQYLLFKAHAILALSTRESHATLSPTFNRGFFCSGSDRPPLCKVWRVSEDTPDGDEADVGDEKRSTFPYPAQPILSPPPLVSLVVLLPCHLSRSFQKTPQMDQITIPAPAE